MMMMIYSSFTYPTVSTWNWQVAKVIWRRPYRIRGEVGTPSDAIVFGPSNRTSICSAELVQRSHVTDRLRDAGIIERNSPHLMYSMRCKYRINYVQGEHKPARRRFWRPDLDLCPMTLKRDRDMHILKSYLHTENKVARSSRSKAIA